MSRTYRLDARSASTKLGTKHPCIKGGWGGVKVCLFVIALLRLFVARNWSSGEQCHHDYYTHCYMYMYRPISVYNKVVLFRVFSIKTEFHKVNVLIYIS